jgi:hypothetical protein
LARTKRGETKKKNAATVGFEDKKQRVKELLRRHEVVLEMRCDQSGEVIRVTESIPLRWPSSDERNTLELYKHLIDDPKPGHQEILKMLIAHAEDDYGGALDCRFERWFELKAQAEEEYGGGLNCTYKEWLEKKAVAEKVNGGPLPMSYRDWLIQKEERRFERACKYYEVMFVLGKPMLEEERGGPINVDVWDWVSMSRPEQEEHVAANLATGFYRFGPDENQRRRKQVANSWISYCRAQINARRSPTEAE